MKYKTYYSNSIIKLWQTLFFSLSGGPYVQTKCTRPRLELNLQNQKPALQLCYPLDLRVRIILAGLEKQLPTAVAFHVTDEMPQTKFGLDQDLDQQICCFFITSKSFSKQTKCILYFLEKVVSVIVGSHSRICCT